MTIEDVLNFYKTGYNMYKTHKLSHGNITNWKKKGYIPIITQIRLEKLTNGALKADLKHCGIGADDDNI